MTTAIVSAVVTLLISIGGGIGWLIKRHDAKADPLPRHAAEIALSREALGIIKASADALESDVNRLREDREADRKRIDMLEADVNHLRSSWAAWYHDLRLRWTFHREQDAPPTPPTIQE